MRHLRVKRTNVAHCLPRGKRATWSGNQPLPRASKLWIKLFQNLFYEKRRLLLAYPYGICL
ncbi:hypothetical protein QUF49_01635 [Fictibacillus sp. b24]|uniref:hypothetical protein n=1 Tax=Fictibacillus sp. b24 TaxID=3055863 RepID=UPI0025A10F47|nr:hypothetical protein [Fictibacillus sp. b24]MDM5314672.1 hypothetical protein [Fictibacillus sp. b24]